MPRLAQVDPSSRILIWSTTQTPYVTRKALAKALSLPLDRVRIRVTVLGGAFGGKAYLKAEPICVALALKTRGRPVKLAYTREEEFGVAPVASPHRDSLQDRNENRRHLDGTGDGTHF